MNMNANWLTLLGLILEIIGVFILIRDDANPLAARIKQSGIKLNGNFFDRIAFHVALVIGSSKVSDQESYILESFVRRFWGFLLILLGFVFQAGVVLYHLLGS